MKQVSAIVFMEGGKLIGLHSLYEDSRDAMVKLKKLGVGPHRLITLTVKEKTESKE